MVDSKLSALLRKHPNLENFVANFRSKHLGLGGRCAGKALRAAEKSLI